MENINSHSMFYISLQRRELTAPSWQVTLSITSGPLGWDVMLCCNSVHSSPSRLHRLCLLNFLLKFTEHMSTAELSCLCLAAAGRGKSDQLGIFFLSRPMLFSSNHHFLRSCHQDSYLIIYFRICSGMSRVSLAYDSWDLSPSCQN
jgi:hypothetical protein